MKKRKRKLYSPEKKRKIISDFLESGMTAKDYSAKIGVNPVTLSRWTRDYGQSTAMRKSQYSPEQRRFAVTEFIRSGMTQKEFARVWNIDQKTLSIWLNTYKKLGPQGLENGELYGMGKKRGRKEISSKIKKEVLETSSQRPGFGLKKLSQYLFRFGGVKVSPNTIKKTLEEADSYEPKVKPSRKKSPPAIRRFERANPMQLWQTDITSFVLPRSKQRVYLVVFMDDNSRYIVSWSLALKQTGVFVLECLMEGIDRFGKPEEVLSDQGRQYFSWRGKSEFQRILHQEGIEHVVSRSHHPQTLGKCERFWKTVATEYWDRVNPKDLDEARGRIAHFINHYNHFRPHQGIDGLVPADRFFGLAEEVRESIEKTFSKNELRMALDMKPKKPFFFVGQVGDQKISMHGEEGGVVVHTPTGEMEKLNYDELGRKNNGRTEEYAGEYKESEKDEYEASTLQDSETSNSYQGIMGCSDSRRETGSSEVSDSYHRVLDRSEEQTGSIERVESNSLESVANESKSFERNVCRSFKTTKSEGEYDIERRRPSISEEEDQGARSDYRNARPFDCNSEINAGMQRGGIERGELHKEGGQEWEKEKDTVASSNYKSAYGWWKPSGQ